MPDSNFVLVLRTRKCRKSDVFLRFLQESNLPFEVKYLETDNEAQALARQFRIKSSPGIIINGRLFSTPYQLIENCRVKEPYKVKQAILNELNAGSQHI